MGRGEGKWGVGRGEGKWGVGRGEGGVGRGEGRGGSIPTDSFNLLACTEVHP